MDFETSRIIDSNGQKYRVGWDEHGWFTIQIGEIRDGEFYQYEDQHTASFPPAKTEKIVEIIEER